jgi:DNA-binding response OmpR family regulator
VASIAPAGGGEPSTGPRVLIVEDEPLLAETLSDLLMDAGCQPVGPVANVSEALRLIEQSPIDVAVLDIRLVDEMSFPVAYALRRRGIPLLFLTAYQRRNLPMDLSDEVLIEKPFKAPVLLAAVRRALAPGGAA